MPEIAILPATPDRFDDAEHALTGGGDGGSCQCQWWTITNAEWQQTTKDDREGLFRGEIEGGTTPGLVAYVDSEAAGWVRVGPRTDQVRIGRTHNITSISTEPQDDPGVWAVSCFVVRKEHRREGLNAHLLEAAVDFARTSGARVLEGYPVDPEQSAKKSSNQLFHGVLSTFENAGFREVGRARPDRPVVALNLR